MGVCYWTLSAKTKSAVLDGQKVKVHLLNYVGKYPGVWEHDECVKFDKRLERAKVSWASKEYPEYVLFGEDFEEGYVVFRSPSKQVVFYDLPDDRGEVGTLRLVGKQWIIE